MATSLNSDLVYANSLYCWCRNFFGQKIYVELFAALVIHSWKLWIWIFCGLSSSCGEHPRQHCEYGSCYRRSFARVLAVPDLRGVSLDGALPDVRDRIC